METRRFVLVTGCMRSGTTLTAGWLGAAIAPPRVALRESGIPNFANREFYVGSAARLDYDRWEFIQAHCSGDLLFPPGSESQYSDANYVLLAAVVESVTGLGFGEVLREQIFRPAGMNQSEVMSRGVVHVGLASSYAGGTDEESLIGASVGQRAANRIATPPRGRHPIPRATRTDPG